MQEHSPSELIHGLDERPAPLAALFAALQHLLASFVGVITPPLVIGAALGLEAQLPELISMALMVSGIGTFIQAWRPLGIGAGMICLQGTSFTFLGAVLAAGQLAREAGGGAQEVLALIFGVCFLGAFVQIILSRFIGQLRRVISPLTTGIVITLIGISLIKVGITDIGGGFGASDFGAPGNLALGGLVLLTIVLLNRSRRPWLRLSAIILALALGTLAAWLGGRFVPQPLPELPALSLPQPFRYGFDFAWAAFVPVALVYLISSIETIGDLTANCLLSRQPLSGPSYMGRLRGGVLGDGVSCLIAATLGAFPNTTFAQNNGVIQMTGVASRHVGLYIGALLFALGLFPALGALLQQIPKPVLGGATLIMFGSVAAAGIRILACSALDRRDVLVVAASLGIGLGIAAQPQLLQQMPGIVRNLFDSAITSGGLAAILLDLLLPRETPLDEGLRSPEHASGSAARIHDLRGSCRTLHGQQDPGEHQGNPGQMVGLGPLAQQQHREDGAEHRHQVDEQRATRRPHGGDARVVAEEAEKGRHHARVENAADGRRSDDDRTPRGDFPGVQRRHGRQPDRDERRQQQHRMHPLRPPLQPHGVEPPGQHRGEHPQVAGVQLQRQQGGEAALGHQEHHPAQGDGHAQRLVTRQAPAEAEKGQGDGRHGDEGVEQDGAGCRGVLQGDVGEGVVAAHSQNPEGEHRPPAGAQGRPLAAQVWQGQRQDEQEGGGPAPEGQPHRRQVGAQPAAHDQVPRPEQRGQGEQQIGIGQQSLHRIT